MYVLQQGETLNTTTTTKKTTVGFICMTPHHFVKYRVVLVVKDSKKIVWVLHGKYQGLGTLSSVISITGESPSALKLSSSGS